MDNLIVEDESWIQESNKMKGFMAEIYHYITPKTHGNLSSHRENQATRRQRATIVHGARHGLAVVVAARPLSFTSLTFSSRIFVNHSISHGLSVLVHGILR